MKSLLIIAAVLAGDPATTDPRLELLTRLFDTQADCERVKTESTCEGKGEIEGKKVLRIVGRCQELTQSKSSSSRTRSSGEGGRTMGEERSPIALTPPVRIVWQQDRLGRGRAAGRCAATCLAASPARGWVNDRSRRS